MTMVFDRSHKEIIGGPVIIEDDEPATKYRAESDGRTFWAYNGMEVFYEDERLYGALDRIEALEGQLKNIKNVYDSIDLNACVMAPRKLFDLTDAIYADNKGKDQ